MCFHVQQKSNAEGVHAKFGTSGPVTSGIFNGFTHPKMTVITAEKPTSTSLHHWGLIPHWAKDNSIAKYTLNARLETLHEKPSFRAAKRCLVLSDGFYEWQWQDPKGNKKQKHLVTFPRQALFAFAGLWDEWVDRTTGEILQSFAIVTTEAQGIMREIHNSKLRMPLCLTPATEHTWLAGKTPIPYKNFCTIKN